MTILKFPGGTTPPEDRSQEENHAEAFVDLEGHIADCVCMGEIAAERMLNAKCDDNELAFAVYHLCEMLLNLKKGYYAAWEGGDALTFRLINHPAKSSREIREDVRRRMAGDTRKLAAMVIQVGAEAGAALIAEYGKGAALAAIGEYQAKAFASLQEEPAG
jgi:hypothetical protein